MHDSRIARGQLLGATVVIALVASVSAALLLWPRDTAPPDIQGSLLPEPRPLPGFRLVDHRGNDFSGRDLQSSWHLLSYGFTNCPDICPTTLNEVAEFRRMLDARGTFNDLRVLFYTVDPERDTVSRLANYVPWFHEGFRGLRAPGPAEAETFETGLGINARVTSGKDGGHNVSHGLLLYLLNDEGELQAALTPTKEMSGHRYYEPARLLEDYLAIRQWRSRLDS